MPAKNDDNLVIGVVRVLAKWLWPVVAGFGGAMTASTSGEAIVGLFYHPGWFVEYKHWLLLPCAFGVIMVFSFWSFRYLVLAAGSVVVVALAFALVREIADPAVRAWRITGFVLFNVFFAQIFGLALALGIWWLRGETRQEGD